MDKILRIDMSAPGGPAVKAVALGDYAGLGGRAMTSAIVAKEVPPTCHPLGTANKLVIAPGLLSGSAALVLPSTTEGISRVAMEAMAMGKPVIGTDIPGNRELIDDGRNGIMVPMKDPKAIAGAIDRLLRDGDLYNSMSNQAKDHIRKNHSAERAAREYEKLYEKLTSRN